MAYDIEAILMATGAEEFTQAFRDAEKSVSQFEKAGKAIGDIGKDLTKKLTLPIVGLGVGVTKVGMDFDTSMSKVQALSGATGSELQSLENIAREMGATTRYSAGEAADGLGYMALAGWDTEQMISALPSVLNLATAGQLDLAKASDVVTDMMSMFGLEANEAARASDVFAYAQANSNLNVEQLSEALISAGPSAAALGDSLESTSAILGVFANQGLKGSRAGTTLDAMYRDIQKSAENGAIAIGDTSVRVYDAEGKFRGLSNIMKDVESATEGMTDEQRRAALEGTFLQQSMSGVNLLLQEGTDSLFELENGLYNSAGAGTEMAAVMDDNMAGSLEGLKSAISEVALSFWDIAEGPIRDLTDKLTGIVRWFGNLDGSIQQTIVMIAAIVAAIGPVLLIVSTMMTTFTKLKPIIDLLALAKGKLAVAIGGISAPVLLIIGVIAGLIAIFVKLYKSNEDFRNLVDSVWSAIKGAITGAISAVSSFVKDVFGGLVSWWKDNNELIRETVQVVWDKIESFIMTALGIIVPMITTAWEGIKAVTSAVWEVVKSVITTVINLIQGIIKTVMQIITGDWRGAWETIKNTVSNLISGIRTIISNILNAIVTIVVSILNNIKAKFTAIFNGLKTIVSTAFNGVKNAIKTGINAGLSIITNIAGKFKDAGRKIVTSIADGIRGAISKVTGAISSVTSKIRSFLPFSPAKEGPLTDIDKLNFGGTIADSVYSGQSQIESALNDVLFIPDLVSSQDLNSNVYHDIQDDGGSPAYITLVLGGNRFRAFVEDITNLQNEEIRLETEYGI